MSRFPDHPTPPSDAPLPSLPEDDTPERTADPDHQVMGTDADKAIEDRGKAILRQMAACKNPKVTVSVPTMSGAHAASAIQAWINDGAVAQVWRRLPDGEKLLVAPPVPPGHWTTETLLATCQEESTFLRFAKVRRQLAAEQAARLEIMTNHALGKRIADAHSSGEKAKVDVAEGLGLASQSKPSISKHYAQLIIRTRTGATTYPLEISERDLEHLKAKLRAKGIPWDIIDALPYAVIRQFVEDYHDEQSKNTTSSPPHDTHVPEPKTYEQQDFVKEALTYHLRKNPQGMSDDELEAGDKADIPPMATMETSHAPSAPEKGRDGNQKDDGPGTLPPSPSIKKSDPLSPQVTVPAQDEAVPNGYPWSSFAQERADRDHYELLQAKPPAERTQDDHHWLSDFRGNCRKKRALLSRQEKEAWEAKQRRWKEIMSAKCMTWRQLLAGPTSIKLTADDRRIGEAQKAREDNGRVMEARTEKAMRQGMLRCQKAMDAYARIVATTMEQFRANPLPKPLMEITPSLPETPKGYLLLPGESPEVTAAIHRACQRKGIERPMIDLEVSAPDGFVMTPEWARYLAQRIATRLGTDPQRALAASHDPAKERSKRHQNAPVKSHFHLAIPVVQQDGSYLHIPHLPAIIQAELSAINREIGMPDHIAAAMRGPYAAAMSGGPSKLYIEKRYDPKRYTEEIRKRNEMDQHGIIRIPLSRYDRDVAAIPMPDAAFITSPAGVGHLNTMSEKRRRASLGDQKRHDVAIHALQKILREVKVRGMEQEAILESINNPDVRVESLKIQVPRKLREYITGTKAETPKGKLLLSEEWKQLLQRLMKKKSELELQVRATMVDLVQTRSIHAYITG